jgi:hypothetical protein
MAATAPYVPRHPVRQPFKNPPCHGVALERGGVDVFSLDSSGTKALTGQNNDDDIHPARRTLPAIAQGRKVSVVGPPSRWPNKTVPPWSSLRAQYQTDVKRAQKG